jgi:hypothetical protein
MHFGRRWSSSIETSDRHHAVAYTVKYCVIMITPFARLSSNDSRLHFSSMQIVRALTGPHHDPSREDRQFDATLPNLHPRDAQ